MKINEIEKVKIGLRTATEFVDLMSDSTLNYNINDYPHIADYIKNNRYSDELIDRFLNEENYKIDHLNKKENINKFVKSLDATDRKKKKVITIKYKKLFAGITAAVLSVSLLIWHFPHKYTEDKIIVYQEDNKYKTPTIIFSSGKNENISDKESVQVSEYTDIQAKDLKGSNHAENLVISRKIEYNTIVVPSKYTLNVVLDDGTKVKLNANSELKYPIKFSGGKREIFLTGEAYFDVVKGKDPFIVNTKDISVKVYGTKFNVHAYNNEVIETTLVSGSIGVKMLEVNEDEIKIEPNQMFVFDKKQNIYGIKSIDPKINLSWISGYISCHKSTLFPLLVELTRWYGTEFEIDSSVDINTEITISQSKELPIEKWIIILENITNLTFIKSAQNKYTVIK